MNLADDAMSGMRAREITCPPVWPKHYRPLSHRLLGLHLRVRKTKSGVTVDVPASRLLLAALLPTAAVSLWAGSLGVPHALPDDILAGAGHAAQLAGVLAFPLLLLTILSLRKKQSVIQARPAPEPVVTVVRRGIAGSEKSHYRRGQVDSLRIAERRDHKLRRHFTLELFADDGFDHVLLRSFAPAELEQAARAIRNTIEPRVDAPTLAPTAPSAIAAQVVMARAA